MKLSPIAIFAAGFIAGSVLLGGAFAAHARITSLNASIAGVLPNSEGSLFCVTAANVLGPIKGAVREGKVTAQGGTSEGVSMRCPP